MPINAYKRLNGGMDDLQFYVLFSSISVMIMKGCVQWNQFTVEMILPRAGLESRTAKSVGHGLIY